VRARPGAPVAVPLHWVEVADRGLEPRRFTLRTVRRRLDDLDQAGDPWSGLMKRRYSLTKAQTRLDAITPRRNRLAARPVALACSVCSFLERRRACEPLQGVITLGHVIQRVV
jgi:hypothetical protein